MTLRSFGRAVPAQLYMLHLVGFEAAGRDLQAAAGGNARKRAMREGLQRLRKATGADFGYDAASWRQFLIDPACDAGYTHPYAFSSVDAAVVTAMADPEVIAALDELKAE